VSPTKTIVLGDEYDDELWATLSRVLRNLGARVSSDFAVGGSQELGSSPLKRNTYHKIHA
jgi:hypothetical protein